MSNKAELVDGFLALSLGCALEERNKSHPSAHLAVSLSPFVCMNIHDFPLLPDFALIGCLEVRLFRIFSQSFTASYGKAGDWRPETLALN